jgi:DNA invertase Pin-like site-specific DNA recombinase
MRAALYARVSTIDKDQNPEVQLVPLREYSSSMKWESEDYVDKSPAADLEHRIAWTKMMKDASLHKFDVLLVWKLDRAFRSLIHAKNTIDMLRRYNIHFRSLNDPGMDTNTPNGELLFNILASFAQYEKDMIAQRVIAGMEYAKVHGTKSGVPIGRRRLDVDLQRLCKALLESKNGDGSANFSAAGRKLGGESAGFVSQRLTREAQRRQISREDLLKEILKGGN